MLLSHNFDVSGETVPTLDRAAFAAVFEQGLQPESALHCQLLEHPHWMVDVRFPLDHYSPQRVGELCGQALMQVRRQQVAPGQMPQILVLGGLKTSPPTSASPAALQPGEWGVDVVETAVAEAFLQGLNWDAVVAQRPADSTFKVEFKHP